MAEKPNIGFKIIGTIKSVKGKCNAGHKSLLKLYIQANLKETMR